MYEVLVDVVHAIIEYDVTYTYFLIVSEVLDVAVNVVEYFLQLFMVLGLMLQGELEHHRPGLYPIHYLEYDEQKYQSPDYE